MSARRVFVNSIDGPVASVTDTRAHHLCHVVRLRPGDRVELSDQSRVFAAMTTICTGNIVEFSLIEELPTPQPEPPLTAAIAIFKYARFEWAIEKLTELGVDTIQPVIAEHTDKGLGAAAERRLGRWRRVVYEAAQQARRVAAPLVNEPRRFKDALGAVDRRQSVIFDVESPKLESEMATGPLTFFIGPEGGWSEKERDRARAAGIVFAGLGPLVLRAETAAISAAAICRNYRTAGEASNGKT